MTAVMEGRLMPSPHARAERRNRNALLQDAKAQQRRQPICLARTIACIGNKMSCNN